MALSNDLISQLVKVNKEPKKPSESTSYGTAKVDGGKTYVQLDGSDMYTPVNTTSSVKDGDRVIVRIKDHNATVTGNMSDPSASGAVVETHNRKISEFDIIMAHTVKTEELEAFHATIEILDAKVGNFENISVEELTAIEAIIENLKAKFIDVEHLTAGDIEAINALIDSLEAKTASIGELDAVKADIDDLRAYTADFTYVSAEVLEAMKASIKDLDVENLEATYAKITDLNAVRAKVGTLDANIGKIDTLMFGTASGTTIQTEFSNSVIEHVGEAQIQSAMIASLDAGKITAGTIKTNNVQVMSDDGKLLVSDETIQISDDSRVRVQIGKDAANDYSINIWDEDGNLMFSKGGITDSAIKKAIIRNDMISDEANISAGKLDISGLFEEINKEDNTYILKSSKILMDAENQTLEVAFKTMKDDMESQGTKLSVVEGAIEGRIWKQDITIGGRNLILDSASSTHTRTNTTNNWLTNPDGSLYSWSNSDYGIASLADGKEFTLSFDYNITGVTHACEAVVGLRYTSDGLYSPLDKSIPLVVGDNSGHYSYTFEPTDGMKQYGTRWTILRLGEGKNEGAVFTFTNIKFEKGNTPTDWTPAPEDMASAEDMESVIKRMSTAETSIEQNTEAIKLRATKTELTELEDDVSKKYCTIAAAAEISLKTEEIESTVKQTYATKSEVADTAIGGRNLILDSACSTHTRTNTTNKWLNEANGSLYVWRNSEYGNDAIADGGKFTLSFDYKVDGITTACNMVPCLRATDSSLYTDIDKSIPLAVGNNTGHYSHTFEPSDGMKEYGTQWIISGLGEGKNEGAEFTFTNIKFEKGDKATYWTPAPEDMDSVIERMVTAETSIKQNADAIALSVKNISENYYTIEGTNAAIDIKADEITQRVEQTYATKTEVDDIKIGGRNLILDSASSTHTRTNTTNHWLTNPNGALYVWRNSEYGLAALAAGGKFTLSFDYNITGITTECTMTVGLRRSSNGYYDGIGKSLKLIVGENVGHYSHTFVPSEDMMQYGTNWLMMNLGTGKNEGAVFTFTNIKLEKGNKATDWTPAPEDIEERVSKAESSIEQKANEITLSVTRTIENIDIGGRNLMLDSATKTHTRTNVTKSWFLEDDGSLYVWRNSEYGIASIADGGEFTLSFDYDIKGITTACSMLMGLRSTSASSHTGIGKTISLAVGDNLGQYSHTFTPSEGQRQYGTQWILSGLGEGKNADAVFTFTNIKLEKGNKATDWTPAPEDVDTDISNAAETASEAKSKAEDNETKIGDAKSEIKQLADQISMLVVDDSGTSLMTQNGDGWSFNISGIKGDIDAASRGVNDLNGALDGVNGNLDTLNRAVDDLSAMSDYVNIATYNDQPCIELGEAENDFKLRITNTDIQFIDGDTIPAYVNNQKLMIEQAEVKNELQFGGFVWKTRDNGNMGILWKGGSS